MYFRGFKIYKGGTVKRIISDIKRTAEAFNSVSKNLMIYGGIIVLSLWAAALIFYIFRGKIAGYYCCTQLSFQLLECGRDCLMAAYLPAFLIEIIIQVGKKDDGE